MALQPNLQIAAGHNNAAGLTALETAITINGKNEYGIMSWGNGSEGIIKFLGDATVYFSGLPNTKWVVSIDDFNGYWALRNTYCSGSIGGLVTIKTNLIRYDTYTNYNATLLLPQPEELQIAASRATSIDLVIKFFRMVAL